ncbi:MAG TPA: hypothetical protein VKU89_04930 [Solirubrobacteraceae bacterium]|nr:hypothetical protein [Solirubrobacteraceae bacterium]
MALAQRGCKQLERLSRERLARPQALCGGQRERTRAALLILGAV